MIEIKNLNKVYHSKKRKKCHALKNINLTLPDTGLVFVLGKSGSGKSTFLNLIGGLDSITSGNVIINGNDLSKFSETDFCNYRNDHIGFIFQDYHLIEDLTVYDNIALSLQLKNEFGERERVSEALVRVGLAGYEARYPQELSGGEQQRVAIARALVKNPHVILADEPTGNLDFATAKDVLDILKELSRDCLILVVSHNVNDTYKYADRIIELSYGEIISNRVKNHRFPTKLALSDDEIVYPESYFLTDEEIRLINKNHHKKIVKRTDKFVEVENENDKGLKIKISKNKFKFSNKRKLSFKFLKHKSLSIVVSSFMMASLMVILAFAQTIISFDNNDTISREMNIAGIDSLYFSKESPGVVDKYLDSDYRLQISPNDITKIKDVGYNGKIYPVYNVTVPAVTYGNSFGFNVGIFSDIFIKESLGTMAVDEEFLIEKFGAINYLATAEETKEYGIIITDYIADSILAISESFVGKTYNSIVGEYIPLGWNYDNVYINAIIDTNYKSKHRNILNRASAGEITSLKAIYNDPEFLSIMGDIYDNLGFSYSLAPNFAEIAYETRSYFSASRMVFNDTFTFISPSAEFISFIDSSKTEHLGANEMSMSIEKYNQIFNTRYDASNIDTFIPHQVNLTYYRIYDLENQNPIFNVNVTIAGLHEWSDVILFNLKNSNDLRKIIGSADTYAYGLYLDGNDGMDLAIDLMYKTDYNAQGYTVSGIRTMSKAVEIFIPVFELIAIVLCAGAVLIILSFSSKMITDKMHEIGILKALGAKNNTVSAIFGLQIIFMAFLTSFMLNVGYYVFVGFANTLLFNSLKRLAPYNVVLDLDFLYYKPAIAIVDCALIFALSFIALLLPLIKVKAIKPVKIIKTKE